MQQSYAKVSGVFENLPPDSSGRRRDRDELSAPSSGMASSWSGDFRPLPPVRVDRHKVLQILINLLRNAKYALDDVERIDKRITVSISPPEIRRPRTSSVADNGIGISAGKSYAHFRPRLYHQARTATASACTAAHWLPREMGGSLSVHSAGLGTAPLSPSNSPIASITSHA